MLRCLCFSAVGCDFQLIISCASQPDNTSLNDVTVDIHVRPDVEATSNTCHLPQSAQIFHCFENDVNATLGDVSMLVESADELRYSLDAEINQGNAIKQIVVLNPCFGVQLHFVVICC